MENKIFLDNASTTKVNENAILEFNSELQNFYNASASYSCALDNKHKIEEAKRVITNNLGIKYNDNFIFTASATESNNLAIFGSIKKTDAQIVFSEGEHLCIYNCALELKARGYNVVFIPLNKEGTLDLDIFKEVLKKPVAFMSCIHVSNETGAENNILEISKMLKDCYPNAIFHSDGVQAFGNIKVNLSELKNVDLYTISAHKIGGMKGVAGLFVRNKAKLKPIIFGGGQEFNLRGGTENLPVICSFAVATKEKFASLEKDFQYVKKLNEKAREILKEEKRIVFNSPDGASPYILSVSFVGVKGETLVRMCDDDGLLLGTGSACSSKKIAQNRILKSMGKTKEENEGAIRLSFSKNNTEEEIEKACEILLKNYRFLLETLK